MVLYTYPSISSWTDTSNCLTNLSCMCLYSLTATPPKRPHRDLVVSRNSSLACQSALFSTIRHKRAEEETLIRCDGLKNIPSSRPVNNPLILHLCLPVQMYSPRPIECFTDHIIVYSKSCLLILPSYSW